MLGPAADESAWEPFKSRSSVPHMPCGSSKPDALEAVSQGPMLKVGVSDVRYVPFAP